MCLQQQLDLTVSRIREAAHTSICCPICAAFRSGAYSDIWRHLDASHHITFPTEAENCCDPSGLLGFVAQLWEKHSVSAADTSNLELSLEDPALASFFFPTEPNADEDLPEESTTAEDANQDDDDGEDEEILIPAKCLYCSTVCDRPLVHMLEVHHFDFTAALRQWSETALTACTQDSTSMTHEESATFHAGAADRDMFRIRLVNFVRFCIASHKSPFNGKDFHTAKELENHLNAHPNERFPVPSLEELPQGDEALIPLEPNDGIVSIVVQLGMEDDNGG